MRLISVEPSKGKEIRYLVTAEEGLQRLLLGETVLRYHLQSGTDMDEKQWREICLYDDEQRMVSKGIDLLSRRERSESELRNRFAKAGYLSEAIDRAIERLKDHGHLNDSRFARRYAGALMKKKAIGEYRLRSELAKKGITGELLESVVAELLPEQENKAHEAAIKKIKTIRDADPEKRKARLWRFLEQRGFASDIIRKVLEDF